jgi:hypothetical protein
MRNELLDRDRPDNIRLTEAAAHRLSVRALEHWGFSAEEARITAD